MKITFELRTEVSKFDGTPAVSRGEGIGPKSCTRNESTGLTG